ncbi:helix-turn-helix domain-containing protein [Noviherbaspirillum denitrificans]|uniref:CdaR family transcriptional regulator n=1 Tax=Noviherbaspirillum denitrificans TaxID=1968433 RepID=A0A254TMV9_9BURK|nr:helix-turn-helix domain-containing protein [Noviherbaspirillum denitrificans]OWW22682.1 CdaR family transcriptional regulator [Noviherbaspirillum denitrificans]
MSQPFDDIAADLIGMLHRNAPAEEFAVRLSRAEALPDDTPGKSRAVELVRMATAVQDRLEFHQKSEQGMIAMVESAKDLSSRLDLAGLLRAIVARARNLLGAQLAWLTAYDEERDEFRVLVTDGAISANTTKMTVGRRRGIASAVMSTRLPFCTPDYLRDNRFPHDAALDDAFRDEGIAALAGVPLLYDDNVIGLLFVADRYQRSHTALNVAILSTLATHAAVAINNAKAFEQTNIARQNADAARAELERHAHDIQSAAEAHEQLTSLLAKGASLATLCQTVANLLGGSVLVVDEAFQVISRATAPGYTGSAAEAYAPHAASSAAITQAVSESRVGGRSILAYEADGEICRAVAVIGGNDLLGAVLLFRQGDLGEISIRTFERSSSVIGIVLLSQERTAANKSRDVSALLRSLIAPRPDERAVTLNRPERFGLDLSQPLSLILLETENPGPAFVARRLRSGTPLSELVLDEVDDVLVIVSGTVRSQDILKEFIAIANREFGGRYRGIVSKPILLPAEIPALYASLRRGLAVLRRLGVNGKVIDQNEMAMYSVLFETHDQGSLKSFLHASIGALLAYDQKRGTRLAETLLCYFDNNQNAQTTATRLGIHVNTVRQRMASAEELLGFWSSPSRALEIHVALRLWSLTAQES